MNRLNLIFLWSTLVVANLCMGQEIVIDEPELLSDSVNTEAEDTYPLLSPDGRTLYFVRTFCAQNMGGELAGQDIWYSHRADTGAAWQAARPLTALNTIHNNVVTGIAQNEDTLYLLNTYSGPLRQNRGIAFSSRLGDAWHEPQELDVVFRNTGPFKGYYVSADGGVILQSTDGAGSYGKEDIYIYLKENGKWNKPIHLDETINTPGFEISPFLTEDKQMLFFASDGHGGRGSADIFMARRLDDTWANWSTPVNLGEVINTEGFEAFLSLRPDGEAFFASNRSGKQYADIYTTTIKFDSTPPPEPELPVLDTIAHEVIVEETFYTVQILALKKREAPEKNFFDLLDLQHINMYVGKDGFNRFSIGEYDTLTTAVQAMDGLRATGYPDAFVRKIERYTELSVRQGENVINYYQARME